MTTIESVRRIVSETYGSNLADEARVLMDDGRLPRDTLLRLDTVGMQVKDPDTGEYVRKRLLSELIEAANTGRNLSDATAKFVYGSPPDVLVNLDNLSREELNRATVEHAVPVYGKPDLVEAVKNRREREGTTIEHTWRDRAQKRRWSEHSVASGLAHATWRALLTRARPDWLSEKGASLFWHPQVSQSPKGRQITVELDADVPTMRRTLVASALFSDSLLTELVVEARNTGIRNLGRVGLLDLQLMLSEQHPELHPDAFEQI